MSALFTESGVRGSAPAGVYVPVLNRVSHGSMRIVLVPAGPGTRISQPLFPHHRSVIRDVPRGAEAAEAPETPARIVAAAAPAPNSPRLLSPVFMTGTRSRLRGAVQDRDVGMSICGRVSSQR